MTEIKKSVEKVLVCPACGGAMDLNTAVEKLVCQACGHQVELVGGKPIFTTVPETIQETEFRERGEGKGTPWRQANWKFLKEQIESLPADALVLDVGSGRGDFSQVIQLRNSLAMDIYPYPEVDIVCDLTSPRHLLCYHPLTALSPVWSPADNLLMS
jgi:DNA-directed RNA polymerase subunit RPC12/RpoP